MRFKLTLEVNKTVRGNILPINYQYEQSAVIYKILSRGNEEYANWLHENGFTTEDGKHFKLFSYSQFFIPQYKIKREQERIVILSDTVEWIITFMPEKSTEKFIQGIFNSQVFEIGDKQTAIQFRVRNIEVLPKIQIQESMNFTTLSPLFIKEKIDEKTDKYLSPTDDKSQGLLLTGLLSRYEAYYKEPYSGPLNFRFEPLSQPKKKKITIKTGTQQETGLIGYMCDFRLTAPAPLMLLAYESGLGGECSMGFGCIEEIEKC